ncbi:MAG: ribosome maturation factor RimP [Gammaproteobacteria bacterium]|nr:ribosome maturation factor RimP [Gammaproteobacteria bacterium]
MKELEKKLAALLNPTVKALGFQLWGCEIVGNRKRPTLRVFIDKDGGIVVEDCEVVSHQVSAVLDVEDPITGAYTLEVSSPGIDRRLFTVDQMLAYKGSVVKLRVIAAVDGKRNFSGFLVNVIDGKLLLEVDGVEQVIALSNIDKVRIVPELRGVR